MLIILTGRWITKVKILLICPIPVEFNACREILSLRDTSIVSGCRTGRVVKGSFEITALESGPAKVRSTAATVAGILNYEPDLVVDTGSCAGLEADSIIGQVVIGENCYEYDISGEGIPSKIIPEMKLESGLSFLEDRVKDSLIREAAQEGKSSGFQVRTGIQACGEYLIQSLEVRQFLHSLLYASACNWETAGVFIGALKNRVPPLSFRVVTDLGNENALADFKKNIKPEARNLYRYLRLLIETGWFALFIEAWKQNDLNLKVDLPSSVLP